MSPVTSLSGDLTPVWHRYRAGGTAALREATALPAHAHLYAALLARAGGDHATARNHAAQAAAATPDSLLAREVQRYLARDGADASLYAQGDAFAAFIRGGGNQALYQHLGSALRRIYREHERVRLLDIGVGDGLGLLSALDERLTHVDLLEPSAPMLARTAAALAQRGFSYQAHGTTLESFLQAERDHWTIAQATFSLQCLPPGTRAAALPWLRQHCDVLLIAEFDSPLFAEPLGPARAAFLLERYERGIAEYTGDRDLVAQGFLVPILLSQLEGGPNQNFEQPIDAWVQACRDAGFADVRAQRLCAYWWSDAYLVTARA